MISDDNAISWHINVDFAYTSMPPPLPLVVSALSIRTTSLYPGIQRKELQIVALVQVSVIAITSGARSMAVAFSSSIFEITLRALVENILSRMSWFLGVASFFGREGDGGL